MPAEEDRLADEILDLKRQMIQSLQDLALGPHLAHRVRPATWQPPTDVYETGDCVYVRANVAGVEPEQLAVVIDRRRLTIQGSREDRSREQNVQFRQLEIEYGPFRRTIVLPRGLDPAAARSTCKNGLLELVIPKRPSTKAARITIRVGI